MTDDVTDHQQGLGTFDPVTYKLSPCGNTLMATMNGDDGCTTSPSSSSSSPGLCNGGIMMRQGEAKTEIQNQLQDIRIQLTPDTFVVQREELVYTQSTVDHVDAAILNKERTVYLRRERVGGLGLSVKGGAEHNLPVLVSRIFKDQAADKTGQLFVGDAILRVNSTDIEQFTHDDAVQCLKNAGDNITLTVKYFRPASLFLNSRQQQQQQQHRNGNGHHHHTEENGNVTNSDEVYSPDQQWMDLVSIPLLCAYVSCYSPGGEDVRPATIEVYSMDGSISTGGVVCKNQEEAQDWMLSIHNAITHSNAKYVATINKTLLPPQQVQHMCWVAEYTRIGTGTLRPMWKSIFLAFKGTDVMLFDTPPVHTKNWLTCRSIYKIYECLFRVAKENEIQDARKHCLILEDGHGGSHYLSVETRQHLNELEKVWYKANYHAIKNIQNKTFGCTWRGNICGLTLDVNVGFSLYDSESKLHDCLPWQHHTYMWSYRFSQLKGSSDDGEKCLTMHFLNEQTNKIEMREIECTNLQTLLFAMHAFLSAKLASVDPAFLVNL